MLLAVRGSCDQFQPECQRSSRICHFLDDPLSPAELGVDLHNGMESDVYGGISGHFAFPTTLHCEISQFLVLLVLEWTRRILSPLSCFTDGQPDKVLLF